MLTGISKGGFGGGAGGAATPLLAMVIPPAQGAAIMLPVLCVMDVFGIRAYLWRWDARLVRITVSAGLIGCAAGALAKKPADRKSTRLNSSHSVTSRMPSSA